MSPEPYAVADAVTKRYATDAGVVVAIDGVDASFPAGTATALVGVSGSGKSTLLRLLAGHEAATGGRLEVAGANLASLDGRSLRRYRRHEVAYVAQRPADNLFPHLTIAEHVPGADRRVFERFGIEHRLGAYADQLSGGELARAAFAVALGRGARFVLLDEPTAELDHATAGSVLAAIAEAAAGGTTIVVATHDPDVLGIAGNVVELTRGRNAPPGAAPPVARRRQPGAAAVLRAVGLSKAYGQTSALQGAAIELHPGELSIVVGRSGSGKSTLLMLLGGWEEPDAGSVVADRSWDALAYVPQRFGLVPELTVRENVDLPARLARRPGETTELLARFGLDDLADRVPAEISIGQQQRAAIARALCLRPRVLLVDEPTSHQDAASAEHVWQAIAEAAARGTACLIATHEPDAHARADARWEIDEGRLARR